MFYLTMAFARKQLMRIVLSVTGIALAAVALLSLSGLTNGFRRSLTVYYSRIDGIYVMSRGSIDPLFSSMPAGLEKSLSALPGVTGVTPEVWGLAASVNGRDGFFDGLLSFTMIGGIKIESTNIHKDGGLYPGALKSGRLPGRGEVMVSSAQSAEWGKSNSMKLEMNGRDWAVSGIYETSSVILDRSVIMEYEEARALIGKSIDSVSCYYVTLAPGASFSIFSSNLILKNPAFHARQSANWMNDFRGILSGLDAFTASVMVLSGLLSVFFIMNTLLFSVRERLRDFAIMLAEGFSLGRIGLLLSQEGLIMAVSGWAAGTALSILLSIVLKPVLPYLLVIEFNTVATAFLVSCASVPLAALPPLYRISRIEVAHVFRGQE